MKKLKTICIGALLLAMPNLLLAQKGTKKDTPKDTCFSIPNVRKSASKTLVIEDNCEMELKAFQFKLMDRWGNVMYQTRSLYDPETLDLTEKVSQKKNAADKYPEGMYCWTIEYITEENPKEYKSAAGFVHIYD